MMHQNDNGGPTPVDFDPFAGAPIAVGPTTEPQREVLAAALSSADASVAYNEPCSMLLRGPLDAVALRAALADLAQRHESLRICFAPDALSFVLLRDGTLPLQEESVQHLSAAAARAAALAAIAEPFDLVHGPLARAVLYRLAPDEHRLLLVFHHAVVDGWSVEIIARELAELYSARVERRLPALTPAPSFVAYARERAAEVGGEEYARSLAYWVERFRTLPPVADLPLSSARPRLRTFSSGTVTRPVDPEVAAAIRAFAAAHRVTHLNVLLAAHFAFLHRATGARDLVTGIAAAGQVLDAAPGLVGHCVHILPVRIDAGEDTTFRDLLQAVRNSMLDAQEHHHTTFGTLLRHLSFPRDPGRVPLAPVAFNLDGDPGGVQFSGLAAVAEFLPRRAEAFEWFINVVESGPALEVRCAFNSDLRSSELVEALVDCFLTVLSGAVHEPDTAIGRLPLLAGPARERVLVEWNRTAAPFPSDRCIHQLIEEQARRAPDAVAVDDGAAKLTYAELDNRAGALARQLARAGVGPERVVGLCVDRSALAIVAILAIWKAGGAYLPLDPDYPVDRLAFMFADAAIGTVLTQRTHLPLIERVAVQASAPRPTCVLVDDTQQQTADGVEPEAPHAGNLAYLIYTSGSTGRPKGVLLEHRGLCNLATVGLPFVRAGERVLQFATLNFDASVAEIAPALARGATVCIPRPEDVADPALLHESLKRLQVNVATLPPSLLAALDPTGLPQLHTVVSAGEPCPAAVVRRWAGGRRFVNGYGPTESTVCATAADVDAASPDAPPIGRPLANLSAYILDAGGAPLPPGIEGELCIGGVGLARGYLNRPELTAERFIVDPFSAVPGDRLYRTGDRARYRPDGTIDYAGRADFQLKVRGLRIEAGEVEAALEQLPGVQQAVVVARGEVEDRILVAYVVFRAGEARDPAGLRDEAARTLPRHMVPGVVIALDAMPLTSNGKVDRAGLPDPEQLPARDAAGDHEPPTPGLETQIASIWQRVLGVSRLSRGDDFFMRGGHSLLGARVTTLVQAELGVGVPLRALFEAPTLAAFAAHVAALSGSGAMAAGEEEIVL